eukprot:5993242-Lingulodinium_polyedra.AAC.1
MPLGQSRPTAEVERHRLVVFQEPRPPPSPAATGAAVPAPAARVPAAAAPRAPPPNPAATVARLGPPTP